MNHNVRSAPHYDPNHLLDSLIETMQLPGDRALSRKLNVAETLLRSIRRKRVPVSASMLMWMHEATGIAIPELRRLMGDRRLKCRLSRLPRAES